MSFTSSPKELAFDVFMPKGDASSSADERLMLATEAPPAPTSDANELQLKSRKRSEAQGRGMNALPEYDDKRGCCVVDATRLQMYRGSR